MTVTIEELNELANGLYEQLSALDRMGDPFVEIALKAAVDALNHLCFVIHNSENLTGSEA